LAQVEPLEEIAGPQDAEIETHVEASCDAGIQLDLQDAIQSFGPAGITEVSITEVYDTCVLDEQPSTPATPAWTARSRTDCIVIMPEVPAFEIGSVPDSEGWPQTYSPSTRLSSCELKPRSLERGCTTRSARSSACPRRPTFSRQGCAGPQVLTLADRVQKEPTAKPGPPRWGRQRSCSAQIASSLMTRRGKRAKRQALKSEQTFSVCSGEDPHKIPVATPGNAKSKSCRSNEARFNQANLTSVAL